MARNTFLDDMATVKPSENALLPPAVPTEIFKKTTLPSKCNFEENAAQCQLRYRALDLVSQNFTP